MADLNNENINLKKQLAKYQEEIDKLRQVNNSSERMLIQVSDSNLIEESERFEEDKGKILSNNDLEDSNENLENKNQDKPSQNELYIEQNVENNITENQSDNY